MDEQVKFAAALSYQPENDSAPRVVAKGKGEVARRILACARENGIPVSENGELAAALLAVDLDREIPEELYQAVAEILSFVYRLESKGK
jgi:flagellar biosynthesis protein